MRNGLKTVEFYKTVKVGDKFIVDEDVLDSYYFNRGETVTYLGYNGCHGCSFQGCKGKGRFVSDDDGETKTFCMSWSAKRSSTCEWTFLKPISTYPKIEVDLLERELFEI